MDLRSAYPYWLLKNGILNVYPSLQQSIKSEVVIIGSGISGSLVAWYLHKAGVDVTVVDRRHVGMGSTVASTALLQYEIDTPLHKLVKLVGEKEAVTSYLLCRDAIYEIEKISKQLRSKAEYEKAPSFQYASFKKHVPELETEFLLRRQYGFEMEWLDEKAVTDKYGFAAPAGILSKDGAQVNAYGLANELLQSLRQKGVAVYDHTTITDIIHHKRSIELLTENDCRIQCKQLIIACGYESQKYIPFKVCDLHSTYAIVSEPLAQPVPWYKQSLIWETSQPYIYLRSTRDHRVLIGGKDDDWSDPKKRDRRLPAKAIALEEKFHELFPGIPFITDFKWGGVFATTRDGLPFIGSIRQRPYTWFALGFGGNGITFSVVAAAILRDLVTGRSNPHAGIFRFDR